MKLLSSASVNIAPSPRAIKSVAPPTAFHARTGEFTAPGIAAAARVRSAVEFFLSITNALSVMHLALLANIDRQISQTRVTISCDNKLSVHEGSQSQRARSVKINLRQRDRGLNFFFTIHEKNRALVNLRSLLLETSLQRVYHVVFANTLHDWNAPLARKPPWRTASGSKWLRGARSAHWIS